MAGAGGTSPKQGPKQPTIDDLREALIPELMKQLGGGMPTPPQYQPAPISPVQGYAMARNPQAAGFINQTIQAPGQAQFQQQQAAFEQAMQGRREALGAGVSILGQQTRSDRYMRPQLRMVQTKDEKGNPVTVPMEYDPASGSLSPIQTTEGQGEFPRFVPPRTLASPTGFQNMDQVTGKVTPVVTGGGQPVYPQPPSGVVTSVAAGTATLGGLDDVYNAYQEVRANTAGKGDWMDVARQRIGTAVGETRLGGALAPEYAKYTARRRASLNAYIKNQTGAQFSINELDRYDTQYPEPWDPEDVAVEKIRALRERALADMQAKLRAFPGASGAAPKQTGPYSGMTLRESDFANAKPGERERFIFGGGKVVP